MKVTPEHLAMIREAVAPLDTEDTRARYRAGEFPRAAAVQDLNKRYRWDVLHASSSRNGLIRTLYAAGYNDAHIYTALRAVVADL